MALGNGQRQLIVVLYFVRLKDDRRVLVLLPLRATGELGNRWRHQPEQARADHGKERAPW